MSLTATLISTLPGDICGLIRCGSPLSYSRWHDAKTVAFEVHAHQWREPDGAWQPCETWCLDLADPTGRAHAAWWVAERVEGSHHAGARSALTGVEYRAWTDATQGRDMTALAIDTLARLVLRLAGRQP